MACRWRGNNGQTLNAGLVHVALVALGFPGDPSRSVFLRNSIAL